MAAQGANEIPPFLPGRGSESPGSGAKGPSALRLEIGPALDEAGASGAACLTGEAPVGRSLRIPLEGGRRYVLSGWCRAWGTHGPCRAVLHQFGADGRVVGSRPFIRWFRPREWVRADRVVRIEPDTRSVQVEFKGCVDEVTGGCETFVTGLRLCPTEQPTFQEALDTYVRAALPPLRRGPWMIYAPDELPSFKERCSWGPGLVIWRHLLARCERQYGLHPPVVRSRGQPEDGADRGPAARGTPSHSAAGFWGRDIVHTYALAAAVTRRERYVDKAVEWLSGLTDLHEERVRNTSGMTPDDSDLSFAVGLGDLSVGFDMMCDRLEQGLRDRLVDQLSRCADHWFDAAYIPRLEYGGDVSSWQVPAGIASLGLCGLALTGHHRGAGRWLGVARFFFSELLSGGHGPLKADGGDEGGYGHLGRWLSHACQFFHCLRRGTGENLLMTPTMRRAAFYCIYGYAPPNRMSSTCGSSDHQAYYQLQPAAAAMAMHQGSPEAWWFVAGHTPVVRAPDSRSYPDLAGEPEPAEAPRAGPGWMFLWASGGGSGEDRDLVSSPSAERVGPRAPDLPANRVFAETGVAILRGGWRQEDWVLGLTSGGRGNSERCANQLSLHAFGRPLLLGSLTGMGDSGATGCYLVDGEGQIGYEGDCVGWAGTPAGRTTRSFFSKPVDYVVCDAGEAYFLRGRRLVAARRHVACLRPGVFVVRDRLAVEGERPVRFDLVLRPAVPYGVRGSSIEIPCEAGRAVITLLAPADLRIERASGGTQPPSCVIGHGTPSGSVDFVWTIVLSTRDDLPVDCRLTKNETVLGVRTACGLVLWSRRGGECRAESVVFDGEMVVVRADGSWALVDGRRLAVAGETKADHPERVSRAGG